MKIHDQMTLRELEDGLNHHGLYSLRLRCRPGHRVGNVDIPRYEVILGSGDDWRDGEGNSVAEAISAAFKEWEASI